MMEKVSLEVAEKEIESWLDHKRVSQTEREKEDKKKQIKELASCISNGSLTLDPDTFSLNQNLLFPIKNEISTEKISYRARINVGKLQKAMAGVKSDDLHGMILAYAAALTDQPKALLKELDTEDYAVLNKIAVFFM